ncbi:MAG: FAD/FMN-binding oxidoreductase [Magnetococcales bacterium]|nr:FAD/FMN-binding oxidoreductase [Magnetococcales bacterium]
MTLPAMFEPTQQNVGEEPNIREIPYNYTSFSDREIVIRFLGEESWSILNRLRGRRQTGRSARMLFEVLGDLWVFTRNPLLQEDLLADVRRLQALLSAMEDRLSRIRARATDPNTQQWVFQLIDRAAAEVHAFAKRFHTLPERREEIRRRLEMITRADHIDFTVTGRVSHMTDATDWRVECPLLVLTPGSEAEVAPLAAACIELGLNIIPRGGGTGYTGSGVPLSPDTVVFNLEALDAIDPVMPRTALGLAQEVTTIRVEAGAVTKNVAAAAEASGAIFAVDPTSQSASTIGGNIAMNAGGKKAVRWGTTLDNLLSWRMVVPAADGGKSVELLEVQRLEHNLGKIHDLPEARFQVTRLAIDGRTVIGEPEIITLSRREIRKEGLGKDVTNKWLGGLPGVQKEGCDGLVTSAVFVLHPMPRHTHTVCLEFYDPDLSRAVPAIVEIKNFLDSHPVVGCAGLEHLDERYVRAVGYNSKATRRERPKMVLLADVVGDDLSAVTAAAEQIVRMAQPRGGEGFVATTPEGRERFWSDRSRTAAIAAHTNAFKINEDVVIPLEKLAEYNEGIERLNIEQSLGNKVRILQAVHRFLQGDEWRQWLTGGSSGSFEQENAAILGGKQEVALGLLARVLYRWQTILQRLDGLVSDPDLPLEEEERRQAKAGETVFQLLLRRGMRISYRNEVAMPLRNLFGGDLWQGVREQLDAIHGRIRSSRLFAALHMHAGDGNVHTNIPVNSNDYDMLRSAEQMVERIMFLAQSLGGCISGEHGIGLTKFRFLEPTLIDHFVRYKQKVDPNGYFNHGKLLPGSGLDNAFTPSLRLVQKEALILKESAMEALNNDMRHCLRCGKCKAVCSTHVPRANLLYSPRNKILATGLVIEAFLYDEQTRRISRPTGGNALHHCDELQDLADHCTVCHRCLKPCPVNIDFGAVTIRIREVLRTRGRKEKNPNKRLAMAFLTTTDAKLIHWTRRTLLQSGYAAQRLGYRWLQQMDPPQPSALPYATRGKASPASHVRHLLAAPLPKPEVSQPARAILRMEESDAIPILQGSCQINPPETVFYFPGCGCERLFSEIALASLAMLRHIGVQTVLPPGYLCCGFPQSASGEDDVGKAMAIRNRVLFHRMADALSDMEIKTVLVSCGTCLRQLQGYAFDKIFPGCRLMDIHEYLLEKGVQAKPKSENETFLFHDPCHSPMKYYDPRQVTGKLLGGSVQLTDRCCGESGLFALSRPDIATQVRYRKSLTLPLIQEKSADRPTQQATTLLTSCPSCFQGLSRQRESRAVEPRFLVVELAERILGESWRAQLQQAEWERVLL